jgi:hypothetical protein
VVLVPAVALVTATLITRSIVERKKERARRTHCANCLRQLATAGTIYSTDYGGHYPTNWSSVAKDYAHAGKLFDCKADPATYHDSIEGVDEWADFVLIPGITTNDPPDSLLAYEPLSNHRGAGANVITRNRETCWVLPEEYRVLRDKHGKALTNR